MMTVNRRVDDLANLDSVADPGPWLSMLRGMWGNNPKKDDRYREMYRWLQLQSGDRVLEVGCGAGGAARLLAQTCPDLAAVIGTDPSRLALQDARAATVSGTVPSAPLVYLAADGRRLPFADASFEAAFCTRVLVHAHEPERIIGEIIRIIRPGGHMLFVEPDRDAMLSSIEADWVGRMYWAERRSVNPQIGRRLYPILHRFGLMIERIEPTLNLTREPPSPEQITAIEDALAHHEGDWWALVSTGIVSESDLRAYLEALRQARESGIYLRTDLELAYLARRMPN